MKDGVVYVTALYSDRKSKEDMTNQIHVQLYGTGGAVTVGCNFSVCHSTSMPSK